MKMLLITFLSGFAAIAISERIYRPSANAQSAAGIQRNFNSPNQKISSVTGRPPTVNSAINRIPNTLATVPTTSTLPKINSNPTSRNSIHSSPDIVNSKPIQIKKAETLSPYYRNPNPPNTPVSVPSTLTQKNIAEPHNPHSNSPDSSVKQGIKHSSNGPPPNPNNNPKTGNIPSFNSGSNASPDSPANNKMQQSSQAGPPPPPPLPPTDFFSSKGYSPKAKNQNSNINSFNGNDKLKQTDKSGLLNEMKTKYPNRFANDNEKGTNDETRKVSPMEKAQHPNAEPLRSSINGPPPPPPPPPADLFSNKGYTPGQNNIGTKTTGSSKSSGNSNTGNSALMAELRNQMENRRQKMGYGDENEDHEAPLHHVTTDPQRAISSSQSSFIPKKVNPQTSTSVGQVGQLSKALDEMIYPKYTPSPVTMTSEWDD